MVTKSTCVAVRAPDKGFAWVVAFACFCINFLMAGLARSSGVLYVALIDLYGVSREVATTPFSIRVSVRNLTGPLVGMMGQRYGIRTVTSVGGLFAALGSIFCYFAPGILWITMFWGIIHGLGFGLSTVIHMMAINQHFDKYRASALGLAYAGDCIGTFVLPVIIDVLLEEFDVGGTFLIIGGIILNVIPLALLLQTPTWFNLIPEKNKFNEINLNNETREHVHNDEMSKQYLVNEFKSWNLRDIDESNDKVNFSRNNVSINCNDGTVNPLNQSSQTKCGQLLPLDANCSITQYQKEISEDIKDACRNAELPTSCDSSSQADENEEDKNLKMSCFISDSEETHRFVHNEIRNVNIIKKIDGKTEIVMESCDLNCGNAIKTTITDHYDNDSNILRIRTLSESRNGKSTDSRSCSIHERNIAYGNEIKTISEVTSLDKCQEVKFIKGNIEIIQNPASSSIIINCDNDNFKPIVQGIDLQHSNTIKDQNNMSTVVRNALKANLKPIFILISVTMAVYTVLFIAVLTVIVDFGVDKGIPQDQGKFLIIAFSATDLIGRLSFGIIIDRKWIPMRHYVVVTVGAMGFVVSIIPLGSEFLTMIIGMAFFGLAQSGAAIMFPILVAQYMTKNEESIAMGCLNFYGGLLLLGLAPLIGFFRDNYGTYDRMFYLVGFSCFSVGLIWSLEPLILKFQQNQKVKDQQLQRK